MGRHICPSALLRTAEISTFYGLLILFNTTKSLPVLLVVSALFFLISYILPNHYFPWVVAYQEFSAFLAVFFLLGFTFFNRFRFFAPFYGLFFLLLAFFPLGYFFAGDIYFFGDAWVAMLYLLCFFVTLLLGYNFGADALLRKKLLYCLFVLLLVAAVISVWIALRQWLMLSGSIWVADMPFGNRPFANFAQPNNLATFLCMAIAAAWYFYERKILSRISASLLVLFLLFGVVLTQSRTPWIGAVVIALFWLWKSRTLPLRLSMHALLLWLGGYMALILSFSAIGDLLFLPTVGLLERAQALHRWPLWVQLWMAVLEGPLWGYGWNQVSIAQVAISQTYPVPLMVEHSHNILLDLLIWNGPLLGGAIICAVAFWLACLGWRSRSLESIFCLIAVGVVLVHGMLELPLAYGFFLFPVGLLLGLVAGEQRSRRELLVPRWLVGAVLVASAAMFAWVWHEYRVIEEDHRLMRFESLQIGDLKAEQAAPEVLLLTQLREFIRFARTPATEGMSSERLEWMRKVAHRYPYRPSLLRYSLALALNGKAKQASDQLRVLQSLYGDSDYQDAVLAFASLEEKQPQLRDVLQILKSTESSK